MKCKICKTEYKKRFDNQKTCLNSECIYKNHLLLKEKEDNKKWKIRKQELKITSVSITSLRSEAKRLVQKFCRMRDEKEPCISCGRLHSNQWDGGHYRKAEVYSGVIFDERNINKQCSRPCNKDLHGNETEYRKGLIRKIGLKEVEDLEELANRTRYKKWTRDELHSIINEYKLKLKSK